MLLLLMLALTFLTLYSSKRLVHYEVDEGGR